MRYLVFLPYVLVSAANCVSVGRKDKRREAITKPLLMPLLLFAYLLVANQRMPWVIAGILFGFAGDVLLMGPGAGFLMAGMGGFLLGHVCYGAAMAQRFGAFLPWMQAALGVMGLLLGIIMDRRYRLLRPHLGAMRLPVLGYMVVICAMALVALVYTLTGEVPGAWLAFPGGVLFVVSDTILAERLFTGRKTSAAAWIMPAYCAAQLLIVLSLGL